MLAVGPFDISSIATLTLLLMSIVLYAAWRSERNRRRLLARDHARRLAEQDAMERIWTDAPLGFALLDRELRYLRINKLLAEINGLSIEEHVGKSLRQVVPSMAPEAEEMFLDVLRTGKPLLGVVLACETVSQPGVERFWRENVYPVISPAGGIVGLSFTVEEFTEEKRLNDALRASEQRERERAMELEAVMEATPAGIFITHSPSCEDVAINAEGLRMLRRQADGHHSLSRPEEKKYQVYVNGMPREPSGLPLQVAAASGVPIRGEELELRFNNGDVRHLLANTAPLRDRNGAVSGAVGAFVDITSQKLAAEVLRQDSRRKDQFIATLAHELRNPLAAICSSLDLIKISPLSLSVVTGTRDIMERQIGHLVRLIDDLLDVSRINTGKLEIRREPMALREVIDYALEVSAPLIADSGHTLELDLPPTPLYVEVDQVRIEQALTNVLHNAAKYTPAGGRIRVEVKEENAEALISVIDNGIGIEPAALPLVFDMFGQAESSRELRRGGIGIGLSLARKLVESHGGTLTASSAGLNMGSTFTIRIPVCEAPGIGTADISPSSDTNASAHAHRILIVDDNADAARLFASLLAMCGHSIEVAYTGEGAIDKAKVFGPDIVFLDLGLPDMNGLEVAKAIRHEAALSRVRLVALTGWGSARDRAATKEAGFDLHFTKPIRLDAIRMGLPDLKLPQGY